MSHPLGAPTCALVALEEDSHSPSLCRSPSVPPNVPRLPGALINFDAKQGAVAVGEVAGTQRAWGSAFSRPVGFPGAGRSEVKRGFYPAACSEPSSSQEEGGATCLEKQGAISRSPKPWRPALRGGRELPLRCQQGPCFSPGLDPTALLHWDVNLRLRKTLFPGASSSRSRVWIQV